MNYKESKKDKVQKTSNTMLTIGKQQIVSKYVNHNKLIVHL